MQNNEYCKPQLADMTEDEMRLEGGKGVIVAAGVAVAVLLVAGAYTVVTAGVTVHYAGALYTKIAV